MRERDQLSIIKIGLLCIVEWKDKLSKHNEDRVVMYSVLKIVREIEREGRIRRYIEIDT